MKCCRTLGGPWVWGWVTQGCHKEGCDVTRNSPASNIQEGERIAGVIPEEMVWCAVGVAIKVKLDKPCRHLCNKTTSLEI